MEESQRIRELVRTVSARVPLDAAVLLSRESEAVVRAVLDELPRGLADDIVTHLPPALREGADLGATTELQIPGKVAELMEPALGLLPEQATVQDAIEYLRSADNARQITYLYTVDGEDRLSGLVVIRDLLLSRPDQPLSEVMLPAPFALNAEMDAGDAITAAVYRHYPVYPVVDEAGRLIGVVRGWRLFERQAIEITAQSGQMVGVDKDERIYTSLFSGFRMRHPWLQINLLTAFLTALVVGAFDETIERVVVLAAFLPVLSCLAGNNGCQALAITLRGLTLGDTVNYPMRKLLHKELAMGALNGFFCGLVGAAAIFAFAIFNGDAAQAPMLAVVMLTAMVGTCVFSCLLGTLVPLALKRFGADPATASSIFVLTATDIMGMGLMLILATMLVL
jgi:magnesium transporter